MKVATSLSDLPDFKAPVSLTIGVYDGLHLGHQAILKQLHKETHKVVLTFSNHPSTYLTPNSPTPLLISLQHRLKLLEELGIDLVIALPFTASFANQSYAEFFTNLAKALPIKHLVVGDDALFGKERKGGPLEVQALNLFQVTYLPKQTYHKEVISSEAIRSYLEQGDLKKVKKMLGRPYSLRLPFGAQHVIQDSDAQYQWTTGVEKLSLLPSAVYAVDLSAKGKKTPGIAFYRGYGSIRNETTLSLTLIFEKELPPAEEIEITFISYLDNELERKRTSVSKTHLLETLKPEFFPL